MGRRGNEIGHGSGIQDPKADSGAQLVDGQHEKTQKFETHAATTEQRVKNKLLKYSHLKLAIY